MFESLSQWEAGVLRSVAGLRSESLTHFFSLVTEMGSVKLIALLTLGLVVWRWRHSRRESYFFAASVGGSAVLIKGLKVLIQRPRPNGVEALAEVTSFSFPSGHSMGSAAFFFAMAYWVQYRQPARAPLAFALAAACTLLIGMSRVYLGVHYPSDVLVGWVLAFGMVYAAKRTFLCDRCFPQGSD